MARACLPAAGLAIHLRLENTMIASKHTHGRSATWRAQRHAATALRHVHREQALMWELWWQVNRASVPTPTPAAPGLVPAHCALTRLRALTVQLSGWGCATGSWLCWP